MIQVSPPRSENELLQRCTGLAGRTLASIAAEQGMAVPGHQRRHKGWIGELMERSLGATARMLSEPDFQLIGVELKTIPVNVRRLPKESTYVCAVPLANTPQGAWRRSNVWRKLARVLWLPVEAAADIPLAERRVGNGILWSPDQEQETRLRSDWEELTEMIALGQLEEITARHGRYLQIRPKAADAAALTAGVDADGTPGATLPRGFYLRTTFTRQILAQAWPG